MRKDWKYIVYVTLAVGLFVFVKMTQPKEYNWTVTLAHEDKNPYGTFALNELIPGILNKSVHHNYKTLYELKDSLKAKDNIIIFGTTVSLDKEDTKVLLKHVADGGTAFISSQYFYGHLSDTLNVATYDYFFQGDNFQQMDSSALKFSATSFDSTKRYWYKKDNVHNYFERFDSTRTTVIARNHLNQPVSIRLAWGKGNIILNSTPLAFTNIYILSNDNHDFVSNTLSYLNAENIMWTEYYHLGRMEAGSPLRFILTTEPLMWAYYITILCILLFMIFEAKRKQRIIPIIKPLANTTLQFVSTIGNLYYHNGDHKNIAEKKVTFFLEQVRSKYFLKTNEFHDEFINTLAKKSGNSVEDVRALCKTIAYIQSSTMISGDQLLGLNERLENFENVSSGNTFPRKNAKTINTKNPK